MKKLYHLFFILNILCSLMTFVNILFLSDYSELSIPLMIGVAIFYITMLVIYFKNIESVDKDILTLSIFAIFLIIYIVFMIHYQGNNSRTYNMLYFSKLIILPSIVYTLYNVLKRD